MQLTRRRLIGSGVIAGVGFAGIASGDAAETARPGGRDALEIYSLNANFVAPTLLNFRWPKVEFQTRFQAQRSYALTGFTLSTTTSMDISIGEVAAVVLVLNQTSAVIDVSQSSSVIGAQVFQPNFSGTIGYENLSNFVSFDPHAVFIPSGGIVSLYGVLQVQGTAGFIRCNANLFLAPAAA